MHTSAQLPVRLAILVLAALIIVARNFGLDAILRTAASLVGAGMFPVLLFRSWHCLYAGPRMGITPPQSQLPRHHPRHARLENAP